MIRTFRKYFRVSYLIIISVLAGCISNKPTIASTSIPSQATSTELPSTEYQLTYVMPFESDGREYQGVFAMDVQCLDKKAPCFDPPELLLKIPKESDSSPFNPYGEIASYSWSPDGKKIAFSAFSNDGRIDIFVADWNGNNLKNITMSSGSELYPSWSIDNQLIYIACSNGRCNAVISDENGMNANPFSSNSVVVFATWMPNGKQVLFVGADDKSVYQIYIANVDGANVKQITHTTENNIVEYASTNGKQIFFIRTETYLNNNFNYNIFSIDIEGKVEEAITTDKNLISFNPSVAPFGNWLAFEQGRDTYDIYVFSLDGKQVFQATEGNGDKKVPKWRTVAVP